MTLLSTCIALSWASIPERLPAATPQPLRGGTYAEVVEGEVDPDLLDELLERASGRAPLGTRRLEIQVRQPSGALLSLQRLVAPSVPVKDVELRGAAVDQPGAVDGILSGKAIYISQCHGWIWYDSLGRFSTQRGILFDTVEDFHNPEGANQYLIRYLENMGAMVYTAKERDINRNMAIADNDGSGYTETGAGFANGPAGFKQLASYPYGTNPFDAGTTRTFPADGGSVATWSPSIPEDGTYVVYVSWDSDGANATDAHYRITHPGGVIDRTFNQTVHGSTWQYVENLWLPAGSSITVELIGDSTQAGKMLSADAVRIGGGMTEVTRHGQNPNRPRWETGAIQYVQYNGAPSSIYDPYGEGTSGDGGSDPSARSRWAAWEHPSGEDAIYLSWHSNAATGTARGTVTYSDDSGAVAGSSTLSGLVQDEIVTQIRSLHDSFWQDRGTATANFSEVNGSNNSEMPAILVELAFHDEPNDTAALKNPAFRQDVSRGMAWGIARYFTERDGLALTLPPEPPIDVSVVHQNGSLVARWSAGPSGSPYGNAASSYLLFRSVDGRSWDNGTPVTGTSAPIGADYGETVFVRLAGVNTGGVSFSSELVGARQAQSGAADVLVVAAFDRQDAGLLDEEYKNPIGTTKVLDVNRINAYDIVRTHGQAIADAGYTFDAATDEVAATLDLSDYAVVVWATGEESTADETFSPAQQAMLEAYLDGGGALFASGAEILWDLDERGTPDDQVFALNVLGATLQSDAATSSDVDGEGALAGISLDFGGGAYPVEFPDVLNSTRPVVARYGDGSIAGVLDQGVALFGFPFDAIANGGARADAMMALLEQLAPNVVPMGTGITGPGPTTTETTDPTVTDPTTTTTDTDPTTPGGTPPTLSGGLVEPERKKGCGCDGAATGGLWWAALAVAALRRRGVR